MEVLYTVHFWGKKKSQIRHIEVTKWKGVDKYTVNMVNGDVVEDESEYLLVTRILNPNTRLLEEVEQERYQRPLRSFTKIPGVMEGAKNIRLDAAKYYEMHRDSLLDMDIMDMDYSNSGNVVDLTEESDMGELYPVNAKVCIVAGVAVKSAVDSLFIDVENSVPQSMV